jgi:hypothetical protein
VAGTPELGLRPRTLVTDKAAANGCKQREGPMEDTSMDNTFRNLCCDTQELWSAWKKNIGVSQPAWPLWRWRASVGDSALARNVVPLTLILDIMNERMNPSSVFSFRSARARAHGGIPLALIYAYERGDG